MHLQNIMKMDKLKWAKTLDEFFAQKQNVAHVFMLVDSRHNPTEDDLQMMEFLHFHTIPFTAVLTKADKLSRMKIKEHIKMIATSLRLGVGNLLATSAETGYGKADVLNKVYDVIHAPDLDEIDEEELDEEIDE